MSRDCVKLEFIVSMILAKRGSSLVLAGSCYIHQYELVLKGS